MARDKRYSREVAGSQRAVALRRRPPGEARPSSLDWPAWIALIERHRRHLGRNNGELPQQAAEYVVAATCSSFRLDGIDCREQEVIDAITQNASQRKLRSRSVQRIRNHVAILHGIDYSLRNNRPLKTSSILRWYTSIASGLSTSSLGADRMARLEQVVGRVNSPQLRLQPAILELASTYETSQADPIFPSFNGILARLLLRFHLGRCGLPGVVFDAQATVENGALALLNAIEESYELLRSSKAIPNARV